MRVCVCVVGGVVVVVIVDDVVVAVDVVLVVAAAAAVHGYSGVTSVNSLHYACLTSFHPSRYADLCVRLSQPHGYKYTLTT